MASFALSAYGDSEALRHLGETIRDDRLRKNLTQLHVAELTGISLPTYRRIERGDGRVEIRHYARVLGILGHVERLRELVPEAPVAVDAKALFRAPRQRARHAVAPAP